jgi:hypothetical protein
MRHKTVWVVAALALVLAACGTGGSAEGGEAGGQNVAVVATPAGLVDAATHTAAAKTGHVEMSVDTVANGQETHFGATGAFDADRHLFSTSLDLSSLFAATMHSPSNNAANSALGSTANVIASDNVVYLDFPLFARLVGVQTQWMSVPASTGASTFDVADPSAFLDFLHGAGGEVTDLGREQIRGVDTTHLHASVKLRDALNSATGAERDRLQRAIDQLGQSGSALLDAEMPADVFIDDNGMVREIAFDFSVPDTTGSTAAKATLTVDLYDFGTAVAIDPPPADQVTDVTAKLAQLQQSPGG